MGKLKKIGIGIIGTFSLIVVLSALSGTGTKDCKSDTSCFQEALKDCSRAKITLGAIGEYVHEITGKVGDSCIDHHTVYSLNRMGEQECLIKTDTLINETYGVPIAHLKNCSNWKYS